MLGELLSSLLTSTVGDAVEANKGKPFWLRLAILAGGAILLSNIAAFLLTLYALIFEESLSHRKKLYTFEGFSEMFGVFTLGSSAIVITLLFVLLCLASAGSFFRADGENKPMQ